MKTKESLRYVGKLFKDTYRVGDLLNKDEMRKKHGEDKIHEFRRSWNIKPDPLSRNSPYHPLNIKIYNVGSICSPPGWENKHRPECASQSGVSLRSQ